MRTNPPNTASLSCSCVNLHSVTMDHTHVRERQAALKTFGGAIQTALPIMDYYFLDCASYTQKYTRVCKLIREQSVCCSHLEAL